MIIISEEQKAIAIEYMPNAAKLFQSDDVNEFLLELNDVIIEKGMDGNYELTQTGFALQQLYDGVLEQNEE